MSSTSSKDLAIHLSIGAVATFLVSWLDIRPLGILFLGATGIWLFSVLCPCSYTLENAKPLQDMVRGNLENFAKLRRDKPAVFCLIVSVALLVLMILGHIVSGTWLVIGGLSVIGLISSRHSIRLVRASEKTSSGGDSAWSSMKLTPNELATGSSNSSSNKEETVTTTPIGSPTSEVDEFLPEVNESAMQVLNLAGDDAILFSTKSNKKSTAGDEEDDDDSIPIDMLMPDESLPDIEKDHLTDDNLSEEEFRLQPVASKAAAAKAIKPPPPSKRVITTSDEEDEDVDVEGLAKGLNFDDFSDVDASQQPLVASYHSHRGHSAAGGAKELTGKVTDFVSNMIPWNKVGNLIAGGGDNQMSRSESAIQKKRRQQRAPSFESSDDDSEFELLNAEEELKNFPQSSS